MNLDELTDQMIMIASDDRVTLARLMIECLQLIPLQLPPVAVAGIKMARQFWVEQSIPSSELENARIDCWNYLDERSASTNTEVPEYCAMRAVICVLYSKPPSNDLGELMYFFNEMLRGALNLENYETFTAACIGSARTGIMPLRE